MAQNNITELFQYHGNQSEETTIVFISRYGLELYELESLKDEKDSDRQM